MNIFVCIKQTPDTETKVKLAAGNQGIDPAGIKWVVSSFDEYAIEEGIRVKEKNAGSTVTILSAGPARAVDSIRTALAMGADNGIHIELPETADNNMIAKALAGALKKEAKADLIFCGKQAIDDGSAQVSQLLAEYMDIPSVSLVVKTEYSVTGVTCSRSIEGGSLELVETPFPVLVTAQKGLNEPRYATLPNIMKAKKKEIKSLKAADVGVTDADCKIRFKDYQLPAAKGGCKKIAGEPEAQAKELVQLLHNEAKVV